MSVEALTARSSGKRAALAREQDLAAVAARRSLVAAKLPTVHQVFGSGTTWTQLASLTRLRISNILHEVPFWAIVILMAGIAINNGHYAGRVGGQQRLARHLPHAASGGRRRRRSSSTSSPRSTPPN